MLTDIIHEREYFGYLKAVEPSLEPSGSIDNYKFKFKHMHKEGSHPTSRSSPPPCRPSGCRPHSSCCERPLSSSLPTRRCSTPRSTFAKSARAPAASKPAVRSLYPDVRFHRFDDPHASGSAQTRQSGRLVVIDTC